MDDIKYYNEKLSHLNYEELKAYLEQHPDFMENLESNDIFDAMKAKIHAEILKKIIDTYK